MRVAFVGCGYIADKYLRSLVDCHPNLELAGVVDRDAARARKLSDYYGTRQYSSVAEVLTDPTVHLVVNLTDPASHYEVSKASLLADKHVYTEKPMALRNSDAEELVDLAAARGLVLSSAPCSVLGSAAQTLWSHVETGAIGKVRLVYAELDDNPIHLMKPEVWTNSQGVPWPVMTERQIGCTLEHGAYHLTWLCAMFGPAVQVDSFATYLGSERGDLEQCCPTPNLAVAVVTFRSGVVARLTLSVMAPYDHRITIMGDEGVLTVEECWNETAPVYLEKYTQLSLNARKSRTVRSSKLLQRLTGVGGTKLRSSPKSTTGVEPERWNVYSIEPRRWFSKRLRDHELISLDFCRGVADVAQAIEEHRPASMPARFCLHVNELALAIHSTRGRGGRYFMESTFPVLRPNLPSQASDKRSHLHFMDGRRVEDLIVRLHRH